MDGISSLYLKPFFASLSMITVSYAVYVLMINFTENLNFGFITAVFSALCSYFIFAVLFGAVGEEDIVMLPMGEKIALVMKKIGFWRLNKREE